ncbi:MAG: glycosyltransferase, partial [Patescibacteria group bacterium]
PTLEAMAAGVPVVASRVTSIPEVLGDAAEYFDPEDIHGMIHAIESVVNDTEKRDALITKGRLRIEHFSWKRMAEETLSIYTATQ